MSGHWRDRVRLNPDGSIDHWVDGRWTPAVPAASRRRPAGTTWARPADPNPFPEVSVFTTRFVRRTAERAVKTAAQTAAALLGAGAIDVLSVDWGQVASVSAGAAVLSVLTSVASAGTGDPDDPSLVA